MPAGPVLLVVLAVVMTACAGSASRDDAGRPAADVVTLPAPLTSGGISLEQALASRRSVRSFTDALLTPTEVGQLLWAAQGVNRPSGGRTAPSAGALYPLRLYVALPNRVLLYLPSGHRAQVWRATDRRGPLASASSSPEVLRDAPAVFVVAARVSVTRVKYGDRAVRYVQLEAGHATQNLLLQAVALGLGGVPMGAFDDRAVARALPLPAGETPLYLVPVGRPAE